MNHDEKGPPTTFVPALPRTCETERGPLLLYDGSTPEVIEQVRLADGLCAFSRTPEREHQLLLTIARQPESSLILASPFFTGEVIGEVTLTPEKGWWPGEMNLYEITVQVSPPWRRMKVARALLEYALGLDFLEDKIIVGFGLSWHWDLQGARLTVFAYREMLARLFASYRFTEYATTEPNIRMNAANIFLARIGKRVDRQAQIQFFNALIQ